LKAPGSDSGNDSLPDPLSNFASDEKNFAPQFAQ